MGEGNCQVRAVPKVVQNEQNLSDACQAGSEQLIKHQTVLSGTIASLIPHPQMTTRLAPAGSESNENELECQT